MANLDNPDTETRKAPQAEEDKRWHDPGLVWIDAAASIVIYFILTLVGAAFALGVTGEIEGAGGSAVFVIGAAPASAVVVGLLVYLRSRPSADYSPICSGPLTLASVGLTRTSGKWLLVGALVAVLTRTINLGLIALYVRLTGNTPNLQPGLTEASLWPLPAFIVLVFAVGLLVPFGEELLFRGVLYGWLRRYGMIVAVPISAIVFGLFHVVGVVVLLGATVFGVLSALLYEKSGSIWPSVVAHAINNTAFFLLIRVFGETPPL